MGTGLTRPVAAVLLVAACAWSVPAAAFCFSMGGGSRSHSNGGYYAPPPAPGIGAGWYMASPYVAPTPRPVILPVVTRDERLPVERDVSPAQQIFR